MVAVVIAGLMFIPVGLTKTVTTDGKVIWEKETEYQYARVIEDADGERVLELNEGQAVHSIYRKGEYLMGGYWDSMFILSFAGEHPPESIVNLGSAAGTVARGIDHYFPDIARRRRGDRPGRDRGRAASSSTSTARTSPRTTPTRGHGCRRRTRPSTRSSWTPTASPTSPST